ncbi:MAG: alpha/beta fold hydrolase, partial [Parvularculaceae bacterium]|nr:alpha/beta fold hydrolase [Parvularculaceae bacterium]
MKTILLTIAALFLIALVGVGAMTFMATRGEDPARLEARYATPADRFIEVDGVRVRVRVEGPETAPPIVLLHGFTFSLESWDAWARELSRTRRVIRYDLAGHGLTGPDPQKRYANEQRAAFHIKVMDALGVARADLAGNSLGGLVAWRVAAAHPERVGKLVLVDAGGYPINGVGDAPVTAPPPVAAFLLTAPKAGVETAMRALWGDPGKIDARRVAEVRDLMRRRGNGRAFVEHIA